MMNALLLLAPSVRLHRLLPLWEKVPEGRMRGSLPLAWLAAVNTGKAR
jgi:hypothetical protein